MRWLKNLFADTGESGFSNLWRRFKLRRNEKRVDAAIEAKRVAQVREDAGVVEVETRVGAVEQEVGEQLRPALQTLEESRRLEREANRRREAERAAQPSHESHSS